MIGAGTHHSPHEVVRDAWPGIALQVQSTHCDMFGHMNHTRYLEFFEWARFHWCEFHGMGVPLLMNTRNAGPAVVRIDIRYRRECRLGANVRVYAKAVAARRQIGEVHQEMWDEDTGERVCEAVVTFVMIDMTTRKVVALPDAFLRELGKLPAAAATS